MRFMVLATATAFLGLAAPAFAAEVSRPAYEAAVEPICKADAKANERILRNVRSLVNKLTTNANRANAQVLAFRFRYCRFEPSKFT